MGSTPPKKRRRSDVNFKIKLGNTHKKVVAKIFFYTYGVDNQVRASMYEEGQIICD